MVPTKCRSPRGPVATDRASTCQKPGLDFRHRELAPDMPSLLPEVSSPKDQALVREILAGSVPAWHRFVDLYGGLILSVVRRHWRRD